MNDSQPRRDGRRTGALALLLGFVAVLLLGAFHPLGLAQQHVEQHVCHDGDEQHVDAGHDHHHDPSTCSFCHLAQHVQTDGQLDGPVLTGPAPLVVRAPLATPAARAEDPCLASFRSRAPPAA